MRTNLLIRLALSAALGLLPGCLPQASTPGEENRTPITSRFFSHVEVIGSQGVGAGEFNKPRSVAVDREDNLYVVDITGRVQKLALDGGYLGAWQMQDTTRGRPKGMDRDADGNIIVIEPHYCRVNHFSTDLKPVLHWGIQGTNGGQLAFPRSVAVNTRGEIYISEYMYVERVQHFEKPGGKLLGVFGSPGQGEGQFNRPEGIAVDAEGRVYVADSCNHRVQIFTADGQFLRTHGHAGTGPGEFSYPYDIKISPDGFQYVCEFGNSRIQIFDSHDKPVEILGGPGRTPDRMSTPWSIAFDSKGDLIVADAGNHRLLKYVRKEPAAHGPLAAHHVTEPRRTP